MSHLSNRRVAVSLAACVFAAGVAAVSAAAHAIVIRHDIPEAAYFARESDYPAVFGLYRDPAGHRSCIATLISPQWAVTAAHCAQEEGLLEAAKPTGRGYRARIAGRTFLIDQVVHHPGPGVDGGPVPDIALLHLRTAVTHVAPIPLFSGSEEVGRVIVLPGWGASGNGQSGLTPKDGLFRVAENLVERAEGGRLFWKFDAPGPNSKALTLEGISGPGDSGGPALINTPSGLAIAGVSSSQDTMGGPEGLYGVEEKFVRVSDLAEWINAHVQISESKPAA